MPPPPTSNPPNLPPNINYEYTPGLYDTPIGPPPMKFHPAPPPPYPPPLRYTPTKRARADIPPTAPLKEEQFDEVLFTPIAVKPISAEKPSSKQEAPHKIELQTPSVFEVSDFLKQLDPLAKRETVNGTSDEPKDIEPAAAPPKQISPGTMYKPIAPPRPSAPSARTPILTKKNRISTGSVPDINGAISSMTTAPIMQSHTRIEILPSNEEPSHQPQVQRADYECMTLDRRGVVAKRHSIKIDTNSIKEPPMQRYDGPYLLTVPGSDYSIVVNNL
ncbi:hypothetical protein COOONC_09528 [Cooperia oncophora]